MLWRGDKIQYRTPMPKHSAYTIVELIIVIVIIGILSAVALPKFFDTLSFSSATYFDEVLHSVRYAQKMAVGKGCDVEVSSTGDSLALKLRQNCKTGLFNIGLTDNVSFGSFVKDAPKGVTIVSNDLPLYFDSLGRAHDAAGNVVGATISVNTKTLQIVGETGFAYEP